MEKLVPDEAGCPFEDAVSDGVGVERIFPMNSPFIDHVELITQGRVRRSRLYYLRDLKGKAARIKPRGRF